MMTAEQMKAGVDANNARAMDPGAWRLRWIVATLIPTGTFFTFKFQVPAAAAFFRLEYLMTWWPVGPGAFRPLFVELGDDRGQDFVLVDKGPALANGAAFSLFTTPNTDVNAALAGDQAAYKGMMPLNLDFPGRATISVNIRGALGTPDPTSLSILLAGHQKNRVG